MTLSATEVTVIATVDSVSIAPVVNGFSGCSVSPSLPEGLELHADTCQITGVLAAPQSRTEYTLHSTSGAGYSSVFAITALACSGNVIEVTRTYKTSASEEAWSIVDDATGFAEYTEALESTQVVGMDVSRRLCLPSNRYRLMLFSSNAYWTKESFIYIRTITGSLKETILRARMDDKMGAESVIIFNVHYTIPAESTWYYSMGSVPANWNNGIVQGWESASMGSFPDSTNQIQLYKTTFTIDSLDGVGGISLNIRYQYGCIIYLNSYESFRNGVDGTLSTESMSSHIYSDVKYRGITLPIRALTQTPHDLVSKGMNTIAVALVASNANQKSSVFDLTLRLIDSTSSARVFDYTVEGTGFSGTADSVFLDYYGASIYKSTCVANYVQIQFNDDRRESITSIVFNTYYYNMNYLPGGVTIMAKNDGDWETLSVQEGWKWWQAPQAKKVRLSTDKPYNMFRFVNFTTGNPDDCYWKLNRIGLYLDKTDVQVPDLAYPNTTVYRNIEMAELYPSSDLYKDFSCDILPEGLEMDPATGVILGTPTQPFSNQTITISAKTMWNLAVQTLLFMEVIICHDGKSLITANIRTDTVPAQINTRLYPGSSTAYTPLYEFESFPSNTMVYQDFCLTHGLYTFVAVDLAVNGWYFPAGYHLSVDIGTLPFEFSHVPAGEEMPILVSTTFSSLLPFQIEYDAWKVWRRVESVPADWKLASYNDSDWESLTGPNINDSQTITFYARRIVPIPDLSVYHVLNVHAHYSGGLIAYFNGRMVARFNLPDAFDSQTYALEHHDGSLFSKFHVILPVVGATSGSNNVIAFEIHRHIDDATTDIAFDATGVFGVMDCSEVVDSVIDVEATDVSSGAEGLFDLDPSSFVTLSKQKDAVLRWTVENRMGSAFNAWGFVVGVAVSSISWELEGRSEGLEDFVSIARRMEYNQVDRVKDMVATPVGIASFREFRWTSLAALRSAPKVSAILLQYCVAQGDICEGVDDYPPVEEGQISPSLCPEGYSGFTYRECHDGKLGEIHTENCTMKLPGLFRYSKSFFSLAIGLKSEIPAPTYQNIVTSFLIDNPETLPNGIQFNNQTGAFYGVALNYTEPCNVTVYALNERGAASITIQIEVRDARCEADGVFPRTLAGEKFVYECETRGNYMGSLTRKCNVGESDGVWGKTVGVCMATPLAIVLIVVVVVVVLVIIGLIVKVAVKRHQRSVKARPPQKKTVSLLLSVCYTRYFCVDYCRDMGIGTRIRLSW